MKFADRYDPYKNCTGNCVLTHIGSGWTCPKQSDAPHDKAGCMRGFSNKL